MPDLETETTSDTTTFEQFGQTWTVPTRKQHSHIRAVKRILREEGGLDADDIAEVYLPPEEYAALCKLDVDEKALSKFANEIGKALGVGDSGNSEASSTS